MKIIFLNREYRDMDYSYYDLYCGLGVVSGDEFLVTQSIDIRIVPA